MIKKLQISTKNTKKKDKKTQENLKKIKTLETKLKKVEKKLATTSENCKKYLNFWKKAEANLINYKKLEQTKINEFLKRNTETIISDLLPILNNFQRAIQFIPKQKQKDNYIQGLLYIEKELKSILKQYGLKKIEIKDKFDPNFHEIIKDPGEKNIKLNKNYKIKEVESGYILNNKVIKTTKIKIINTSND